MAEIATGTVWCPNCGAGAPYLQLEKRGTLRFPARVCDCGEHLEAGEMVDGFADGDGHVRVVCTLCYHGSYEHRQFIHKEKADVYAYSGHLD